MNEQPWPEYFLMLPAVTQCQFQQSRHGRFFLIDWNEDVIVKTGRDYIGGDSLLGELRRHRRGKADGIQAGVN